MGPYEIVHQRDHAFKAKDPKAKRKLCVHCGRGRHHRSLCHHGAPPSLNVGGSGWNPMAFQGIKQAWQARVTELLVEAELPTGLDRVVVEGLICFPNRTRRDQGNFSFFLAKVVGDALVEGAWLPDDTFFPVSRYEFGGLQATYEKDVSFTRLMLFPTERSDSEAMLFDYDTVEPGGGT